MRKKSRKFSFLIILLLCLGLAGLAGWYFYEDSKEKLQEAILEQALTGNEELANLVFKAFSLTQGEAGLEAWRLKAEVASIRQESGVIFLDQPKITYFTRPDNEEMMVTAPEGVVDQGKQTMELWPEVDVFAPQGELHTSRMNYVGEEHTLYFPEEVQVTSKGMSARFGEASWNLNANVFTGLQGVVVRLKPRNSSAQPDIDNEIPVNGEEAEPAPVDNPD